MRTITFLILFAATLTSSAQNSPYLSDLEALRSILQKTPSYKAQITDEKKNEFNRLYQRLSLDTVSNPSDYRYFYNLSQLFFLLQDNHLSFYQIPNYNNFINRDSIERFIASKEFAVHPRLTINIDSLAASLAQKSTESIEGIYHYDKYYDVGVFKLTEKEYIGVILDTQDALWQKGQVAMLLHEFKPGLYKAIYAHPLTKNFIFFPIEKYRYQTLLNSLFYNSYSQQPYSKKKKKIDYVNLPADAPNFEFRNINDRIQYVRIGSFQRNNRTSPASKKLYDTIQNRLTAPYLIVDLRNHEGGAESESRKYLGLIEKFAKKGRVYLLVNNETISQAEIFILKLKKNKNVVVVGETTKGMLTYGSNYGKRERLPSGKFEVYPTDMKGKKEYLQYEDYGITPDIVLNENSDWIQQLFLRPSHRLP